MDPAKKRFPGIRSYESADAAVFFGREQEADEIELLLQVTDLLVVFGKSGSGKSSLLNAGLLAGSRLPGWVKTKWRPGRPHFWEEDRSLLGLLLSSDFLSAQRPTDNRGLIILQNKFLNSLWLALKRIQLERNSPAKGHLLVIDQFEEAFFWPAAMLKEFAANLGDVVAREIPLPYKQTLLNTPGLNNQELAMLIAPLDVRVVLVLRSEFLPNLADLSVPIPGIFRNLFQIRNLSRAQALSALKKPMIAAGAFRSPAFELGNSAVAQVLDHLSDEYGLISPLELQIIGGGLEEMAENEPSTKLDLGSYQIITQHWFDGFYLNAFSSFDGSDLKQAKYLVEELLVASGKRVSVDEDALLSSHHIPKRVIEHLEMAFIIQKNRNSLGNFSYELSFDWLLGPVLRAKNIEKAVAEASANQKARKFKLWSNPFK